MKEPKLIKFKNNTENTVCAFSATGSCVRFQPGDEKEVLESMFKACVKAGLSPVEVTKTTAKK